MKNVQENKAEGFIEKTIFSIKWLLIPFYYGLALGLCVYAVHFVYQVFLMMREFNIKDSNVILMTMLELVDITMIANLVKFIITGSYTSFVNKFHKETGERASSGTLKVKMGTSLVGVTAIHLLQTFLVANSIDWDTLYKQLAIHGMFIVGTLILAVIEYLHEKGEIMRETLRPKPNEESH